MLVDHDVADEAGVGVDAGTDHEAAGLRFLGIDVDDHVGLAAWKHLERLVGRERRHHARLGHHAGLSEGLTGKGLDHAGRDAGCGRCKTRLESAGRHGLRKPRRGCHRLLRHVDRRLHGRGRCDGARVVERLGAGGSQRGAAPALRRGRLLLDEWLRALTAPHRAGDAGWSSLAGRLCLRRGGAGRHWRRLHDGAGLEQFALEHEIDHGIVGRGGIGALAAEPRLARIAGDLLVGVCRVLGLAEYDPRALSLGRIGEEQAARLQPALVVAQFADVEDVARPQRQAIEHRAVPGVWVVAADAHVDLADAIPLPFGDVVDEVELAGLLEKPWIGPNVCEHEAPAAVDVADQTEIDIHLRLIERLSALEFELACEKLALELAVADERNIAH